jgi:hypothetical protein
MKSVTCLVHFLTGPLAVIGACESAAVNLNNDSFVRSSVLSDASRSRDTAIELADEESS